MCRCFLSILQQQQQQKPSLAAINGLSGLSFSWSPWHTTTWAHGRINVPDYTGVRAMTKFSCGRNSTKLPSEMHELWSRIETDRRKTVWKIPSIDCPSAIRSVGEGGRGGRGRQTSIRAKNIIKNNKILSRPPTI